MKQTSLRLLCAGALTAICGVIATGAPASAGDPQNVQIQLSARGVGAVEALDALTVELWIDEEGDITPSPATCSALPAAPTGPLGAEREGGCTVTVDGEYYLGIDGLENIDPAFSVFAYCEQPNIVFLDGELLPIDQYPEANFIIDEFTGTADCYVELRAPVLAVDKFVLGGGPADSSDFTMNVAAADAPDVVVATGADPDNAMCDEDLDTCALINIDTSADQSDFLLSETPAWGYLLLDIECASNISLDSYFSEQLSIEVEPVAVEAEFSVDDGDAYCEVTNRYAIGELEVSTVVINDNGGTAATTDVSFEVFRADSTPQIAATPCAADGSCYSANLPVGDYVMGYVGPAGYTVDVTQTITPGIEVAEMLTDDPDATFTMDEYAVVEIVITIDDPVPATTTTTTTTTTTLPPATTTTVLDASGVTLPSTGTSGDANGTMAAMALLLMAGGGLMLAVRRRTA